MSTSIPSSAPSAERRPTAWSPDLDGGIAWIAIVALSIVVAIVAARISPLAFAIAAAAVLVAVGYAAWRWPLATLVVAASSEAGVGKGSSAPAMRSST